LRVFEAEDRPRISSQLRAAMRTRGRASVQARTAATGRWFELRADARRHGPKQAELVVVVLDIRGHKAREAALAFDALHDSLTGLHNRVALLERTEQALARLDRSPSVLAVAFIDLDRFKEVNDRHGHGVGDRVLMAVGRQLAGAVRPTDTLARMGGDEFVVLCEGLDAEKEVVGVAQRLVAAAGRPISVSPSISVRLGATVGIAFAHGHRDLPSDLIDRADLAMYRAKEQGWESALAESHDVNALRELALIDRTEPTTIDGHRCIRLDEAGSDR
jgi:diguanylate cyclase (GGDEF)-like protein